MTDSLGQLQFPAGTGTPITDTFLQTLRDFVKAVVNSDLGVAWLAVAPGVGPSGAASVPISTTGIVTDDGDFGIAVNERDMPALFVWREELEGWRWLAADYWVRRSTVRMQWIPPAVPQDRRRLRWAFMNGLFECVQMALEQFGRHPAWIAGGDTDPKAATEGSLFWTFAGAWSLTFGKTKRALRVEQMLDGGTKQYPVVECDLIVEERALPGVGVHDFTFDGGLQETITTAPDPSPNATPRTTESLDLLLRLASVAPSTGTSAGGTAITLTGSNFLTGCAVALGGTACTNVVVVSATTITCTTPAHSAGLVAAVVTSPTGESATLTSAYTFT